MARPKTQHLTLAAMHNHFVQHQTVAVDELSSLFNLKLTSVPVYVSQLRKTYSMDIVGRKGVFTLFSDHGELPLDDFVSFQQAEVSANAQLVEVVEDDDNEEAVA